MATASVSVEFQNLTLSECFDQGLASYESICESIEPAKESGTQVSVKLLYCVPCTSSAQSVN